VNPNVSDLFKQARAAAQQENWVLLTQYLQQLIAEENFLALAQEGVPETADLEQVLTLALECFVAGNFQERWGVAKIFPRLGTSAIAPLIEILAETDADLELRWFTARTLGEFKHPAVVNALVELLQTAEDTDLTAMAAESLAKLGSSAIPVLTNLLADDRTRLLAVRSLSQIRHSETITPLVSVIHDPQVVIRATAIEALSSFHNPQVPPILVNALADPAAQVRQVAVFGLGFRPDLVKELDLVRLVQPLLRDFNLDVCQQAAATLGRLGTDAAAAALFGVLQSPATPAVLQLSLVRALGRIETSQSLQYLQQALTLDSPLIAPEIVTVLGRVEQPELKSQAAQVLIDLLHLQAPVMQEPVVKQFAAQSLGQLGESSAIHPLIELLADSEAGVRLHAIAALKKLAPDSARDQLEDLVRNADLQPELKQGVAIALSEWPV